MEQDAFSAAVQRINAKLPERQQRVSDAWAVVRLQVRADVLAATDSLYRTWAAPELAVELRKLLVRCSAVQAPDRDAGQSWRPTATDTNDLWQDCLAVAYHRLYRRLVADPLAIRRAAVSGDLSALDLLGTGETAEVLALVEALETPWPETAAESSAIMSLRFPARHETLAWRLASAACAALYHTIEHWRVQRRDVSITQRTAWLLAVMLLMLEEECGSTHASVLALAAGPKGGVGQISVATLNHSTHAPLPIELALWSRYRVDRSSLSRLAQRISPLLTNVDTMRYRIVFNPPGTIPAAPGHIMLAEPHGPSIGFAVVLGMYAAVHEADLGGYAVTGMVGDDLRLHPVAEIEDKLHKLVAYNRTSSQPAHRVLLPQANITPALQCLAEELGLQLNQTIDGPLAGRHVTEALQYGILCDGLQRYAERVIAGYDQPALSPILSPAFPDSEPGRLDAVSVTADVLRAIEAYWRTEAHGSQGHLICVPYGIEPTVVAHGVAVELARRRLAWARQLAHAGSDHARRRRPPTPLILHGTDLKQGVEAAVMQQFQVLCDAAGAEYARQVWRARPHEFAVMLTGHDDLAERLVRSRHGWLEAIDTRVDGPTIILIAQGVEQMQRWAGDLARAGERIDPGLAGWFPAPG